MKDMSKLESPFVRELHNNKMIITDKVAEGYEWVFEDPEVMCTEKLDGTNVSIFMHGGDLKKLSNRTNAVYIDMLADNRYLHGVRACYAKGRLPVADGQHFGELMGPKIRKNFLNLEEPEWFPFEYLRKTATYNSFHKYEKTFENLSKWFRDDIFSLVYRRIHGQEYPPEGVVFYQPSTGKMARLRRDMFDWYKGDYHNKN